MTILYKKECSSFNNKKNNLFLVWNKINWKNLFRLLFINIENAKKINNHDNYNKLIQIGFNSNFDLIFELLSNNYTNISYLINELQWLTEENNKTGELLSYNSEKIDEGVWGGIYKIKNSKNILKIMKKNELDDTVIGGFYSEILIHSLLSIHSKSKMYVPRLYDIFIISNSKNNNYKYCCRMQRLHYNTQNWLENQKKNSRTKQTKAFEQQFISYLLQILKILDELQLNWNFNHNDLMISNTMFNNTSSEYFKINNVFFPTFGKSFKLIDFGFSSLTYNHINFVSHNYTNNINTEHTFSKSKDVCQLIFDILINFNECLSINMRTYLCSLLTVENFDFWKCYDIHNWNNIKLHEWENSYYVFGHHDFKNTKAHPNEIINDLISSFENSNNNIYCNTDKLLKQKTTSKFHESVCHYFKSKN